MTLSDADVVRDVRRGDRDAYAHLVERYQHRLFGLVVMMVRERAGAEEVTQDAFVRAYSHLGQYEPHRPFYPWIATIAVRLAQNWLLVRGRTVRREGAPLEDGPEVATDATALSDLIDDERTDQLWNSVASLPSGERTAIFLYYRDDMSVRAIADALSVTNGTVKTLLFRGRRHLRERLGNEVLPLKGPSR